MYRLGGLWFRQEHKKNISFVSHQYPGSFLYGDKGEFIGDLNFKLHELKNRCELGTIDAVIVGGSYLELPETEEDTARVQDVYLDSIKLIGKEVQNVLDFEPTIINGPKLFRAEEDNLYYDNGNRRLYFVRSKVNPGTPDFLPSEIEKHKGKWK